MNPNDWMLRLDGLSSDMLPVSTRLFRLRESAMLGAQTFQQGLDGCAKAGVGSCLARPGCVPAGLGDGEQGQDGDARRLMLV